MAFPFAHICSKWPRHNGASHRTKTEKREEEKTTTEKYEKRRREWVNESTHKNWTFNSTRIFNYSNAKRKERTMHEIQMHSTLKAYYLFFLFFSFHFCFFCRLLNVFECAIAILTIGISIPHVIVISYSQKSLQNSIHSCLWQWMSPTKNWETERERENE